MRLAPPVVATVLRDHPYRRHALALRVGGAAAAEIIAARAARAAKAKAEKDAAWAEALNRRPQCAAQFICRDHWFFQAEPRRTRDALCAWLRATQ